MSKTKFKILYIDDEIVNLRLFQYSFRRDFEVFTAQSAKEGLSILENSKLVELLEVINEKYPDIPPNRMIISGYLPDDVIKKAFEHYKLYSFVSKPWNYEKLKETIINAVKK